MPRLRIAISTAVAVTAVVLSGLLTAGCATKRDVQEITSRLDRLEAQNRRTQELVQRMDSLIAATGQADEAMRGELRYSVGEMTAQIAQLLAGYNELMSRLEQLAQRQPVRLPPKSSPGAQNTPAPIPPPSVAAEPARDCDSIYDVSFLLVRQGEYQKAIDGFTTFLSQCEKHHKVENAVYWIGECYYALENYPKAIEQFEKLLKDYPASINVPRALYKLGRSQQELNRLDEAKKTFKRLADEYPNILEGKQAAERLKDLE